MSYGTLGFGFSPAPSLPLQPFPRTTGAPEAKPSGCRSFAGEGSSAACGVERLKRLPALRQDRRPTRDRLGARHPGVSVALVGARKRSEITENIAAAEWRLDESLRAEIDRIFAEERCPTYATPTQITIPQR